MYVYIIHHIHKLHFMIHSLTTAESEARHCSIWGLAQKMLFRGTHAHNLKKLPQFCCAYSAHSDVKKWGETGTYGLHFISNRLIFQIFCYGKIW